MPWRASPAAGSGSCKWSFPLLPIPSRPQRSAAPRAETSRATCTECFPRVWPDQKTGTGTPFLPFPALSLLHTRAPEGVPCLRAEVSRRGFRLPRPGTSVQSAEVRNLSVMARQCVSLNERFIEEQLTVCRPNQPLTKVDRHFRGAN